VVPVPTPAQPTTTPVPSPPATTPAPPSPTVTPKLPPPVAEAPVAERVDVLLKKKECKEAAALAKADIPNIDGKLCRKIASCLRDAHETAEAIEWYERALAGVMNPLEREETQRDLGLVRKDAEARKGSAVPPPIPPVIVAEFVPAFVHLTVGAGVNLQTQGDHNSTSPYRGRNKQNPSFNLQAGLDVRLVGPLYFATEYNLDAMRTQTEGTTKAHFLVGGPRLRLHTGEAGAFYVHIMIGLAAYANLSTFGFIGGLGYELSFGTIRFGPYLNFTSVSVSESTLPGFADRKSVNTGLTLTTAFGGTR